MKQIIDLNWYYRDDKYIPVITFNEDGKITTKVIELEENFNLLLSEGRFCVGYWEDGQYNLCINSAKVGTGFERCKYCESKQGFRSAFLFGNEPNENAKKYLSQKHLIYISYFEPDIIKVGTASNSRRFLRPIEQDALNYAFIAENDGFEIQKLEKVISQNFDITERVRTSQKVTQLSQIPDKEKANARIRQAIEQIRSNERINFDYNSWFIESPKVINLIDRTSFYFPQKPHLIIDSNYLVGKFLGIRGRFFILKNRDNEIVLDRKKIIGRRIIGQDDEFDYGINQISMF